MRASDAATPGIADAAWCDFLAQAPSWGPPAGPLTVIAPRPDDPILGAGGLIYAWAKRGFALSVVCVTDGEATDPERSDMSSIRHLELREALQELGAAHVNIYRLAIPEGEVAEHEALVHQDLLHYAPAGTTLLAPFEYDGLPDHESIGRVCRDIAAAGQFASARYPIALWHHTEPSDLPELRWGRFALNPSARAAKARALQCFESQLRPPSGAPPLIPAHLLAYFARSFEAFVL